MIPACGPNYRDFTGTTCYMPGSCKDTPDCDFSGNGCENVGDGGYVSCCTGGQCYCSTNGCSSVTRSLPLIVKSAIATSIVAILGFLLYLIFILKAP